MAKLIKSRFVMGLPAFLGTGSKEFPARPTGPALPVQRRPPADGRSKSAN